MNLQGSVKKISDIQTFESGFQKQEMILLTQEQYPQPISIEFFKDKIDLLNGLKEGDFVNVHINIQGREWTSPKGEIRYFNTITGWKIESENKAQEKIPSKKKEEPKIADDDNDDLPF